MTCLLTGARHFHCPIAIDMLPSNRKMMSRSGIGRDESIGTT
jgi:hypothetical protein